jgi:hypothetical protein
MYYSGLNSLALEEGVTRLSGTVTPGQWSPTAATGPGGDPRQDFIDPGLLKPISQAAMPTVPNLMQSIAQFRATGQQYVNPNAASASSTATPQMAPSGSPSAPSYTPSAADQPASGPDWTPQPGMMYAAGQAITPQDFINRYGMQTYLEAGGTVGGAAPAGAAPSAGGPAGYSSGSSPAQQVVGGPGIALQAQATGPQVSTGAPTLDFGQYFHGGQTPAGATPTSIMPTSTPTPTLTPTGGGSPGIGPGAPVRPRPMPQRPFRMVEQRNTKPGLKDYETNDIVVHLFLLAGMLYLLGKVRIPKE